MSPIEKLSSLDVWTSTSADNVEIFRTCPTMRDLDGAIRQRHLAMDGQQFLFGFFPEYVKREPAFLDQAVDHLRHHIPPLTPELIREYFCARQHPGLYLTLMHPELPGKKRGTFDADADQLALETIRSWLGYQ